MEPASAGMEFDNSFSDRTLSQFEQTDRARRQPDPAHSIGNLPSRVPLGIEIPSQLPASPIDQNPLCNTLYVGNLPAQTSEEELKTLFSLQRGYKRMCFRTKPQGPMCFVEFEDTHDAAKALTELNGRTLSNSTKGGVRLSFSKNPLGVRSSNNSANSVTVPKSASFIRRSSSVSWLKPPGARQMGLLSLKNFFDTGPRRKNKISPKELDALPYPIFAAPSLPTDDMSCHEPESIRPTSILRKSSDLEPVYSESYPTENSNTIRCADHTEPQVAKPEKNLGETLDGDRIINMPHPVSEPREGSTHEEPIMPTAARIRSCKTSESLPVSVVSHSNRAGEDTANTDLPSPDVPDPLNTSHSTFNLKDRMKLWIEEVVDIPIVWWPLSAPCPSGSTELSWRCTCGYVLSEIVPICILLDRVKVLTELGYTVLTSATTSTNGQQNPHGGFGSTASQQGQQWSNQQLSQKISAGRRKAYQYLQNWIATAKSVAGSGVSTRNSGDYVILHTERSRDAPSCIVLPPKANRYDSEFFKDLRQEYDMCSIPRRYWLGLNCLHEFRFVKLERFNKYIHCYDRELPSSGDYKYEYRLQTPPIPPIPNPVMLHHFNNPDLAGHRTCKLIDLIPKRVDGPLPNEEELSWGLQAVEGLSVFRVLILISVVVSVSVVAGTVLFWWWLSRHANDLQNAAVPLFLILAAISVGLGIVPVVQPLRDKAKNM